MHSGASSANIERWGIFELALSGPTEGNPFTDVQFGARFQHGHRTIDVDGFYDGAGVYRVRLMPDTIGAWRYVTRSNVPALAGATGEFACIAPAADNHGPVAVQDRYAFAYADGAPYFQVGTTCYVWNHQPAALQAQTLATLRQAPFNKLRFCVFPKHYAFNANEPELYPFERDTAGARDFSRPSPAFYHQLEQQVADLAALGIEADLILFHPYDRWGFSTMPAEADDRYLRYIVARLAAHRNIWWSLANEWDLMPAKRGTDWDRFFKIVQESDPYGHLRSVHNCRVLYDHAKPWVTHVSYQNFAFNLNLAQIRDMREAYGKPVVVDEACYEGDIPQQWGSISAQELVRRFWEATIHGGTMGHGETYLHPDDILWWSKGGVLHGQSPARIAFYRHILAEDVGGGLDPLPRGALAGSFYTAHRGDDFFLTYFGVHQPRHLPLALPHGPALPGGYH